MSGTSRRAIPKKRVTMGTAKAVTSVKATGAGLEQKGFTFCVPLLESATL